MDTIHQKTLSTKISFTGLGLHSGKKSTVNLLPAKKNSGIIFKRTDIDKNNLINANYTNVTSARLCTTLENKHGVKVSTVEHLLAALYIYGVDNAIIEVDEEEIPIMDGSAKEFLSLLNQNKLVSQSKKENI